MFDAHILYYAYDNLDGDDFGVGYLGNKEWWTDIVNCWGEQDGKSYNFTAEEFDELDTSHFRDCLLAEVVPDENGGHNVAWTDGKSDYSLNISKKGEISFIGENEKPTSVPRWISRLKKTIKEYGSQ